MKRHSTLIKKQSIIHCQLFCYSIILLLFFTSPLKAQVTIGSQDPPQPFSILELTTKIKQGGLRLPLLSTDERDNLNLKDLVDPEANAAEGLVIYNTTTNCLEFWNGKKWISNCLDAMPDCSSTVFPALNDSYDFANSATIANLITAVGGNVQIYDAPTGGNLYDNPSTTLIAGRTYYVEQKIGNCTNRVPVAVTISTSPVSGTATIDACVTAMYDFQYQTLTATGTTGGAATQGQWYAKRRGEADSEYKAIPGANAVSYKVPANFVKNVFRTMYSGTDNNDSVVFKVEVWNARNTTRISNTTIFDIEFIDTYGNDYAELNANYDKEGNLATGIGLKIAYLNLGQDRDQDGTQNACDFGSLYQWGRIADGHEKITWTKAAVGGNIDFDDATKANQKSSSGCTYDGNTPALEGGNPFYQVNAAGYTGKFLTTSGSGGSWTTNYSYPYFWADATYAKRSNDPCPSGWRVPTRFELGALFQGTPASGSPASATQNTWTWRPNTGSRIAGGMIVTYGNGSDKSKRIFMPATGMRSNDGITLFNGASVGYCWSSTYADDTMGAYILSFYSTVNAGLGYTDMAYGISVRCVKE